MTMIFSFNRDMRRADIIADVAAQHALLAVRDTPEDTPEDAPLMGPGWYESSWDLCRGLQVFEGVSPDDGLQLAFLIG
jgi:hypothetical protein